MDEIATNPEKALPACFPARVKEPLGLADLGNDIGKVLGLAASSGCGLDRMRLVRWDGIQDFVGQRRAKVGRNIAATLRDEIEQALPAAGICIRYDDVSLLVVLDDGAPDAVGDFEIGLRQGIETKLPGNGQNDGPISFWKPIALGDDGFEFEPVPPAAPTRPGPEESGAVGADEPTVQEVSAPSPRVVLADPVYRYCPLWDVGANQVFSYLCEPRWPVGDGEPQPEESLHEMLGDPRRVAIVDMETLHQAVDQVETVVDRLAFMSVLIPVHFQTLATPERTDQYLDDCNARIWPVHDYIYFEIVQPPASVTREDLARAVQSIAPFGSGIMLRLPSRFERFDQIPAEDLLSVGMNVPPDCRPDPDLLAEFRAFSAETDVLGISRHVHGLQSTPLAMGAAYAGFEFVGSGAAASLEASEPESGGAPFDKFKPIASLKKAGSDA